MTTAPNDPEAPATAQARLPLILRNIRDWQQSRDLSDNALLKRYPSLGSTKTYKKLLDGDYAELDLERQCANYEAAWALIEASGTERAAAPLHDDLTLAVQVRQAYLNARSNRHSPARVVFVLADTGAGKSSACQSLQKNWGKGLVVVEATAVWGERPLPFLRALLTALGRSGEVQESANALLEKCIAALSERHVDVAIEEAQHLRPQMLDTLKTLVNRSPGVFVLFALPTLWAKLEQRAYEEVRQLKGNRLSAVIRQPLLPEADVARLLDRGLSGHTIRREPAAKGELSDLDAVARKLAGTAPRFGNFAFIRDVIARAAELGDVPTLTAERLVEIAQNVAATRI